jgi:hypothetical protein
MLLFDRSASLLIGAKQATEALSIAGLRITFDIKKTKSTNLTPNTAKIEVYNLSKDSRDFVQPIKGLVILRAGYKDEEKEIFKGSIIRAWHSKKPPDVITTLECLDGYDIINGTPQTFGFSPGTSAKKCLNSIVDKMKIDKGASDIKSVVDIMYSKGYSFSGQGIVAIDKICKDLNLEFSIQNNAIKFTLKNKGDSLPVDVISSETGMLDSPVMIEDADPTDPQKTKKQGWQVKCLLRPYLEPHNRVQIDSLTSPDKKAQFIVNTIQHSGDTWGNEWTTTVDCLQ